MMDVSTMEMLGYGSAVLMGAVLGLIGGGGSILTVPILVYLFDVPPVTATAYSLVIVGSTSIAGGVSYARQRLVNWRVGTTFSIPAFIGVYVSRRWLLPALPDPFFSLNSWTLTKDMAVMLFFSAIMILAAASMLRSRTIEARGRRTVLAYHTWVALDGLGVGVVTGLVGAGGGFLIIPALVILAGIPMKEAVGTSLVIIAVKSLIGFVGDLQNRMELDGTLIVSFIVLSVIGIIVGSRISRYVDGIRLKKAFGWFVLIMAVYIIARESAR